MIYTGDLYYYNEVNDAEHSIPKIRSRKKI